LKYDLFRQPFSQSNLDDLPLLLGCFSEFRGIVIVEPMPEIRQNFFAGFSRSANDENPAKSLFVFTICFRERLFQRIAAFRRATLFLRGPILRTSQGLLRPASFTDTRMTVKRL
jgi:hypothetical protein